MSNLIREIEDELQADKLAALWKNFQTPIIVGVAALVLGTAGLSFWNSYQNKQHEMQTAALIQALDNKDISKALSEIPAAQKSSISDLMTAAALAKTDMPKAIALYADIETNSSLPRIVRERATLDKLWLQLRDPKQIKIDEAMKQLGDIRASKKSTFVAEANFLSGFLAQTIQKNDADARRFYKAVSDDMTAPDSLRNRALSLSTSLLSPVP